MRTAEEIIAEYRAMGYPDERLRALANSRPEPMRSELLNCLGTEVPRNAMASDTSDAVMFFVADDAANSDSVAEVVVFGEEEVPLADLHGGLTDNNPFQELLDSMDNNVNDEDLSAEIRGEADVAPALEFEPRIDFESDDAVREDLGAITGPEEDVLAGLTQSEADAGANVDLSGIEVAHSGSLERWEDDYLPPVRMDADQLRVGIDQTENQASEAQAALQSVESPAFGQEPEALTGETAPAELDCANANQMAADMASEAFASERTLSKQERKRLQRAEKRRLKKEKRNAVDSMLESAVTMPEYAAPAAHLDDLQSIEGLTVEQALIGAHASHLIEVMEKAQSTEAELEKQLAEYTESFEESAVLLQTESEPEPAPIDDAIASENDVVEYAGAENVFSENGAPDESFQDAEADRGLVLLRGGLDEEDQADGKDEGKVVYLSPDYAVSEEGDLLELRLLEMASQAATEDDATMEKEEESQEKMGWMQKIMRGIGLDSILEGSSSGQAEEKPVAPADAATDGLLAELGNELSAAKASIRIAEENLRLKELEIADVRAIMSGREVNVRERDKEINRLQAELMHQKSTVDDQSRRLEEMKRMRDEHNRLIAEYEDMRKEYNELATSVLPELQQDRDELMLTIERMTVEDEKMRGHLKGAGRRIAVGYTLAAAAAALMIALPFAHWYKADQASQELAQARQERTDLVARLEGSESRAIELDQKVFDLTQRDNIRKGEMAKLEKKNKDLVKQSDEKVRELAMLKAELNRAGNSGQNRESATAMVGPARTANGRLQQNSVRDPQGTIDRVVAANRQRYAREDAALAEADTAANRRPISVSAVARDTRDANGNNARRENTAAASRDNAQPQRNAAAQVNTKMATVKPGEGVAQVVYRELNTRDQEVIDWVIRTNNIRRDGRGNPIIHPNQQIKLPTDGAQLRADAGGRR